MTSSGRGFRILALFGLVFLCADGASAQRTVAYEDEASTREALARALSQSKQAQARARRLEQESARATERAEQASRRAAALAARIQQSEAELEATEARLSVIRAQTLTLRRRLAERQQPLVQLTAALQNVSRRPPVLSLLRPVSVRDMVYLRAALAAAMPQIARRTAVLRTEIAHLQRLQAQGRAAMLALRKGEGGLRDQRARLVALETRQRLESRDKRSIAARETDRALAMAEQAGDLDGLLARLDADGQLRSQLMQLPGPVVRPADPQLAISAPVQVSLAAQPMTSGPRFQLPTTGRLVTGFGIMTEAGTRSAGVTLAPRGGAQVVAPAQGRVAFAGPYRGFGRIVIIEHDGGWTSLVTGLARCDVEVGDRLVNGSPLGIAGPDRPTVTFELRRDGKPVSPLDYL